MNKGLEAYYIIAETLRHYGCLSCGIEKSLNTIETELKRLEKQDKKIKELKSSLNRACKLNEEYCETLNKQDEILRIIKEKYVDIAMIGACESSTDYNAWCDTGASWSNEHLTEHEFDLLKEWLK